MQTKHSKMKYKFLIISVLNKQLRPLTTLDANGIPQMYNGNARSDLCRIIITTKQENPSEQKSALYQNREKRFRWRLGNGA
jgi:hypothetical protein